MIMIIDSHRKRISFKNQNQIETVFCASSVCDEDTWDKHGVCVWNPQTWALISGLLMAHRVALAESRAPLKHKSSEEDPRDRAWEQWCPG